MSSEPTVSGTAAPKGSLREILNPGLKRMLVGIGFSSIGGGLVLSLLVVYLSKVRGIPLETAGLVLAAQAVIGLAFSPVVGAVVDRIGPKPVLLVACVIEAVGTVALGFVHTAPQAFLAAGVVAVGNTGLWAPQAAILSRLAPPEHRQRAFGLQFMLLNLGLGLGGLVGAAFLDVDHPQTFTVLYAANAITFLCYFVAVAGVRGVSGPEVHEVDEDDDGPGGYREVLADRRMRRYVLGALLLLTCGYGSMEAGIPVFITTAAGLPVNMIGVVFFFNTVVIVVAQVWVLKRIEGRSRSRMMALAALAWGACWVLLATSSVFGQVLAAIVITIGVSVFALGETIWSPVAPSLINDLAPGHLRGRYNAMGGLVWGVAGTAGPAFAGVVLARGLGVVWALGLAAGAMLAGGILLSLRHLLTDAEDGRAGARMTDGVAEVRG
jgi:MFS family permease